MHPSITPLVRADNMFLTLIIVMSVYHFIELQRAGQIELV